ncbi:MAG: transcription antitermination protein NusB [Eggerthellaceae bacterium]
MAALDVVRAVRERDAFAQDVIGTRIDRSDLSSEDRAFATKLALGVVSATGTLDEIIDRALNAPSDVKPDVRDALRVSTYEIIFLGKTPHAAVDQGVELVRSFAMARRAGERGAAQDRAHASGVSLRRSHARPQALARLHAFPLWLARKLIIEGRRSSRLHARLERAAPLFIAVNAAKTSDEALVSVRQAGRGLDQSVDGVSVAGCYRVLDARAAASQVKRMFSQGKILVTVHWWPPRCCLSGSPRRFWRWAGRHERSCCKAMRRAPTARSWSCRLTTMRSRRGFCWSAPSATARSGRGVHGRRAGLGAVVGTPSTRCSSAPVPGLARSPPSEIRWRIKPATR